MIIKLLVIAGLGCLFLLLKGCASGQQTDRAYQELGRAAHFTLASDGLIIGFEKRSIGKGETSVLGALKDQPLYSNIVVPLPDTEPNSRVRNKLFRRYAHWNSKVMIPTQIVSRIDGVQEYKYNAYRHSLAGEYDYVEAFNELSGIFRELRESTDISARYTHVFVLNMGWNNDQAESLWRYNTIIKNLKHQALKDRFEFKPFVIAITWPSVWGSINDFPFVKKALHLISYPNKTLDADELGMSWMNWIINDQLPGILESNHSERPKLVLIGHSLGARILTRALFSSKHLLKAGSTKTVDLMIGLQPAFSARRFVKGSGLEGYPYAEYKDTNSHLVFTTSIKDRANPIANYLTGAKHIGGKQGLAYARKYAISESNNTPEAVYKIVDWSVASRQPPNYEDSVLIVDASDIVVGSKEPKLSAHNDILDEDMSKLIWHYIKHL